MANLKEIRGRLVSVNTTQQITKAMKLVAASKLKKAQDRILTMRPYSEKLNEILGNLMHSLEGETGSMSLNAQRPVQSVLIIVTTSDKGLCGAFNSNLIKTARRLVEEQYAAQAAAGKVTILPIGKKAYDFFRRYKNVELESAYMSYMKMPSFSQAQEVSQYAVQQFLSGKYDVVELVYSRFVNAATQQFKAERFLPVAPAEKAEASKATRSDYIFEPEKQQLLEELVPRILNTQMFKALLDTSASEHGARMVAMESATNNAQELKKALSIQYNRERQAAITKEILEIVGGAAALEGN